MHYLYLGLAIVTEVVATVLLKRSDGFTRLGPALLSLAGYAVSMVFLALTLRSISTGVAYAIWSGCGVVLIAILSFLVNGESIDKAGVVGLGLIVAGVVVIQLFSKITTG
ncbi:MAG: QacE family quaternary ammonium compound efflux SMR transporter [Planctomycetaceae bacterium]|nr:QacE family quaternary ammonium compound efflux SMR transporter [Planctomycetaceae bacterium]|tara:strand:+ start:1417 stop:1746 length:330 start_codon:yes stop_codon:yes gene_type:complete